MQSVDWTRADAHVTRTPLLTAYTCEIWPYRLRSRGMTVVRVKA
jgi:hypothetical protein